MNVWNYAMVLCLMVLTTGYRICDAGEDRPAHIRNEKATKVRLMDVLGKAGQKMDCYFTIEHVVQDSDALDMRNVSLDPGKIGEASTVADAVKVLKEELGHLELTAYRSKENPAVVHILGKALENRRDYWLNRRVDFAFSGMLSSGFEKLVKGIENVEEQRVFVTWDVYGFGSATTVRISAENTAIRRILSDSIPLSRYARVLWYCRSRQSGGKVIVRMVFREQVALKARAPAEALSFSDGEKAFRRLPKSQAGIKAAADYITAQLASKTPHQVRWAMLYLGKHKVSQQMPLLIKHLDYKYTTCAILEESHPAVRALALMGKAASGAALKEITKESKDLRLKLLCHLVLLVEGPDAGTKAIKAQISRAATAKQRARIAETLGSLLKSPGYKRVGDTKATTQEERKPG